MELMCVFWPRLTTGLRRRPQALVGIRINRSSVATSGGDKNINAIDLDGS
jgi:hypothetical protein